MRYAPLLAAKDIPLQLAGPDLACPLRLDYQDPEGLGDDRWVAALAAHDRFGDACVVDLGSAVTVDLVESDSEVGEVVFRGGAIAPGLGAMARGLADSAPGLPVADREAPLALPAKSSRGSVDGGVGLGFCGLVERLVADVLAAAAGRPAVVLTGGDAERYLHYGRLRVEHVPDLVHQGLALLGADPRSTPGHA